MSGSFVKDNATMIHIAVELLAAGCILYWVNKKTSTLEEQIAELTEKNKHFEELLAKQGEIITKHQEALQDLIAAVNGTPPMRREPLPVQPPKRQPQTRNIPKTFQKAQTQSQTQTTPRQSSQSPQSDAHLYAQKPETKRPVQQSRVVEVEPEDEDEDQILDEELADELALLECDAETGECGKKKSSR